MPGTTTTAVRSTCSRIDVVLARADGLDDERVEARRADQAGDLRQAAVILADDREAPVEDLLVDGVEVHAQTVTQQRATGDGAHGIERHDGHAFAATHGLGGQRSDERALASPGRACDAHDARRAAKHRTRGERAGVRQADLPREHGVGRWRLDRRIGTHALAHALHDLLHAGPGVVDATHSGREQRGHVFLRDDAADVDRHVGATERTAFLEQPGHEHQVRVAHHAAGDDVCVLVASADGEAPRRLPEPAVDHVHTGIPQDARNELHAAVVPIEAHLAQEHARTVRQVTASITLLDGAGGILERRHAHRETSVVGASSVPLPLVSSSSLPSSTGRA